MDRHRINLLANLIPQGAAYLTEVRRGTQDADDDGVALYAFATCDPQFGWGFVQSFLSLAEPFPSAVHEPELLRTYACLRHGTSDKDVLEACALERPANSLSRILTRCLLILGSDSATISRRTGYSVGTCEIYAKLYFDVGDRDWTFRTSLAYPQGRQSELLPASATSESLETRALRAALQHGMPVVEQLLGARSAPVGSDLSSPAEAYAMRTLLEANSMLQMGFGNSKMEIFRHALQVLAFALQGGVRQEAEGALVWQAKTFIARTLAEANSAIQLGLGHQKLEIFARAARVLRMANRGAARKKRDTSWTAADQIELATAVTKLMLHKAGPDGPIGLLVDPPEGTDLRERKASLEWEAINPELRLAPAA